MRLRSCVTHMVTCSTKGLTCLFVCSFLFLVATKQAMMPPFIHGSDILWENIRLDEQDQLTEVEHKQCTLYSILMPYWWDYLHKEKVYYAV